MTKLVRRPRAVFGRRLQLVAVDAVAGCAAIPSGRQSAGGSSSPVRNTAGESPGWSVVVPATFLIPPPPVPPRALMLALTRPGECQGADMGLVAARLLLSLPAQVTLVDLLFGGFPVLIDFFFTHASNYYPLSTSPTQSATWQGYRKPRA